MTSSLRTTLVVAILGTLVAVAAALAVTIGLADSSALIIQEVRLPRVVMALLLGAALAVAGAVMQGSLQNPLADPSIVGISAAAAVGAVVGFAVTGSSPWSGTLAAIVTAGLAVVVILVASGAYGRIQTVTVLLAGIAVGAFAGALLAVLVTALDSPGMRSLSFWLTGSLALTTWSGVVPVAMFSIAGIWIALFISRSLDVMSLGDKAASMVGTQVARTRALSMVSVVLLLGPAVAITGVVAFVGLVIPHAVRLILGPSHRALVVSSALAGALLILVADTFARTLANPVELPLGAITAALGAPVFFGLLLTSRRPQSGWGG